MSAYDGLEIAIIGMSGHFPMSPDCNTYWQNLLAGKELIREYSDDELFKQGVPPEHLADCQFVRSAAVLEGKEYFDHRFFDYRPEEAAMMDPQIRMFHTHSWKALEDAGYASGREKQKIGLFAAASDNDNWKIHTYVKAKDVSIDPYFLQFISNGKFVSSLTAYKLDLRGPVVYVDSACSSSLAAIHLACRSLLTRECNLVLSGGVKIGTTIRKGYRYQEGTVMSPDGHCRTFDTEAGGTILGEGIGVVVLKRLADAIKSKDNIYAVIRSSAINNDGHDKVGYTAPSIKGQSECIRMAHKLAGIDPRSIGYVEAHGTATKLGDPIEIAALNNAFQTGNKEKYCAIGSVKSNMGHLDAAAGVAGLIKAALSLQHRKLVPSLHFQHPNPKINFDDGPFYVNTELKDWPSNGHTPIRAGVSSFGIGGTNTHVVLEEPPAKQRDPAERSLPLLTLSAKNKTSLGRYIDELKALIQNDPAIDLHDMAFTLQVGRQHFEYRQAIAFRDREHLVRELSRGGSGSRVAPGAGVEVVFMFQDLVVQDVNMGRQLYENEPLFKQEMDKGFRLLKTMDGVDYSIYAQPALFIFEYALAKLIMGWGIKPQRMIGHGLGEYVAACMLGVCSVDNALRLVARRAAGIDSPEDLHSENEWKKRLLQTTGFSPSVKTLPSSAQEAVLVEIGANANDSAYLNEMIGRMWMCGVDIDWNGFYGNHFRKRISLPGYSFEPIQFPAEVEPFAGSPDPGKLTINNNRPDPTSTSSPLENTTEKKVIELLEDFLGIEGLGAEDNFFDLGGDSVKAMGLLIRIKSAFGIQLTVSVFSTDPTIKQLSLRIDKAILSDEQKRTGMIDGHLVLVKPGKGDRAVFIIPGIDGYAYYFMGATKSFRNSPPIYGIQMMGLQNGERPLTTMSEIARQNINWIKQIQPGGPYKLIGFSFGGYVVYEMIRQMESAGDQIDYAALLDVSANATATVDYAETLVSVGGRLLEDLGIIESPCPGEMLKIKETLSGMSRQDGIDYIISFLRAQIAYCEKDGDFWARVLEVQINNVLAIGPVSGRINAELTIVKAAGGNWHESDHDLGWSKHTGNVRVFTVPGTHNQVLHNSLDKILDHVDQMDASKA